MREEPEVDKEEAVGPVAEIPQQVVLSRAAGGVAVHDQLAANLLQVAMWISRSHMCDVGER